MKRFISILALCLIFILPGFTCAQNHSNSPDVEADIEYTDDYITSDGTLIEGSGLNMMQFQLDDVWLNSEIYSTSRDITLTKQGANWIRIMVSDKAFNISDVSEFKITLDSKPPKKIKFIIIKKP